MGSEERGTMPRKRIEITTAPEITKLDRGGYSVRFRIPAHDGKPDTKSKRRKYPDAKKIGEARRAAEEYRRELEDQLNDYTTRTDITFGEYARKWHEDRKELGEVKLSTWERDELEIRQIESSVLSDIAIQDIDETDLDRFKKENVRLGFSNDKQDKLLKKVKQILRYAEKRRAIRHNPSGSVDNIKRKIKDKRKALSPEEQEQLLKALESEEISGKMAAVRIAFSTGFRRGEVLGLQWGDIDYDQKTITLQRQLTQKGEYQEPKFGSTGIIPIGDGLIRYLRRWERITSDRWYGGKDVPRTSPVCRNDNGQQLQTANFDRWRRAYFVELGLGTYTEVREEWDNKGRKRYHKTGYKGYRLHELRHTMATELVNETDLKTAQTIMRHTNISTTARYIHEVSESVRNAAELLDKKRESGEKRKKKEPVNKKLSPRQMKEEKLKAYNRQSGKCSVCGKPYGIEEMMVDWIDPQAGKGRTTTDNIELICRKCDASKGTR